MSEGVDPIALVCTVIFFSLPPVVLMGISNCFRWIVLPTIIGLVGLVLFYLYPICLRCYPRLRACPPVCLFWGMRMWAQHHSVKQHP